MNTFATEIFANYDKMRERLTGNPAPVDAIALVFREGRALVYVRFHRSDRWIELMSAPGTAEDGLACGVDLRQPEAIAAAYHASASTEEIPNFKINQYKEVP